MRERARERKRAGASEGPAKPAAEADAGSAAHTPSAAASLLAAKPGRHAQLPRPGERTGLVAPKGHGAHVVTFAKVEAGQMSQAVAPAWLTVPEGHGWHSRRVVLRNAPGGHGSAADESLTE